MATLSPDYRPNVLVVCNIFRPLATTGIEILRVELTKRYSSVRPIVLTGLYDNHPEAPISPIEVHTVPVTETNLIRRTRAALASRWANVMIDRAVTLLPSVRRLCRQYPIQCIEFGNSNLGFLGYLARRWLKVPYALWVNSGEDPVVSGEYGRFSGPMSRTAFRHAAAVITPSYSTQRYVQDRIEDPTKVHAVQMGVDDSRFSPGPPELPKDLAPALMGRTILLSVARLVEPKGIDTVIRALPAIASQVPDLLYVIVGDRPDRTRLENLAQSLGMSHRVLFAGSRRGDELVGLYRSCQLFVLVSRFEEGLGMAALEAAACGKPIVVGDRGGQPETVDHGTTGLCVPAESVEGVADACVAILTDTNNAEAMGRAGQKLAATMSWDRAAKTVEGHLLQVIQ